MLIYRIALEKYAHHLKASGRAARWNPNDVEIIYTASSISLACLENVVHRNHLGLNQLFNVMTIEVPDHMEHDLIHLSDLPDDWKTFEKMPFTQAIGERWMKGNGTALLSVPSSIIDKETNWLINPKHPDFKQVKLMESVPFVFDSRIKE